MTLNAGQQAAFDEIQKWLGGPVPYFFLSGQAGTGKTFLADRVRDFAENVLGVPVLVSATTNKAAAVLHTAMTSPTDTNTIHSLLGLRLMNDFNTGAQTLKPTGKNQLTEGALVIVDEASMVDSPLMEYINGAALNYGLKVLFIGDAFQLPPVGSSTMPVTASGIDTAFLTEIVRANKRLDLEEVYRQGREMVISEGGVYIPQSSENVSVISKDGSKEYLQELLWKDPHTKVLGYTNSAVESCNMLCRELLGLPKEPVPGDLLVAEDVVIQNTCRLAYIGQEFVVDRVEESGFKYGDTVFPAHKIFTTCGVEFLRASNPEDRNNCLKHLKSNKAWSVFYHMKETLADLRFTHAATVHKSQGSTHKNVMVLVPNIVRCIANNERRRLLYVAYTRASEHLHILTE